MYNVCKVWFKMQNLASDELVKEEFSKIAVLEI